jgi:VWFA-related protein
LWGSLFAPLVPPAVRNFFKPPTQRSFIPELVWWKWKSWCEANASGRPESANGLSGFSIPALRSARPEIRSKAFTKDDFTLLDNGKAQPISIFSAGPSGDLRPMPVPPGAVSNRAGSGGQPMRDATVVLVDLLNTPFELTDYARLGLKECLDALADSGNKIALYTLGENLHILHDFNDDPQNLTEAAAALEQGHGKLPPDIANALRDYGDLVALGGAGPAARGVHGEITVKALRSIVQHLSGVPGRKNLVWLTALTRLPPTVMGMLQQANIVLYPVGVRGVGLGALEDEVATQELGIASGGRGFRDARDLTFAVQTAVEDSGSAYVLGYYPEEGALDGKFHKITVKINDAETGQKISEVHYRSGYLATKVAVAAPAPSLAELFEDPIAATGIGIAAQATPDAQHAGLYDLRLTLDLHDIHLDRKEGHFTGAFDFFLPNPSSKRTVKTGSVAFNLTEQQLADALENGFSRLLTGVEPQLGEIRVVVRDRSTGVAGSVRVPVGKASKE